MQDLTFALDFGQITLVDAALMGLSDALVLLGIEPADAGERTEPTPEDREWWWSQTRDENDPPPDGSGGGGRIRRVPWIPALPSMAPVSTLTFTFS